MTMAQLKALVDAEQAQQPRQAAPEEWAEWPSSARSINAGDQEYKRHQPEQSDQGQASGMGNASDRAGLLADHSRKDGA